MEKADNFWKVCHFLACILAIWYIIAILRNFFPSKVISMNMFNLNQSKIKLKTSTFIVLHTKSAEITIFRVITSEADGL